MKTKWILTAALSLGLLASTAASANDTIWGALIGGGAGAAIGGSVSGRNGAIVGGALGAAAGAAIADDDRRGRVEHAPAPVYSRNYYPETVYYSPPPPVRVVRAPVYYVPVERGWDDRRGYRHHDRHDRNRGWDDHRGYR